MPAKAMEMVFLLLAITLKKQRSNLNYLSHTKWLNDEFISCLAIFGIQHLAICKYLERSVYKQNILRLGGFARNYNKNLSFLSLAIPKVRDAVSINRNAKLFFAAWRLRVKPKINLFLISRNSEGSERSSDKSERNLRFTLKEFSTLLRLFASLGSAL
jgi:hypothetical protein